MNALRTHKRRWPDAALVVAMLGLWSLPGIAADPLHVNDAARAAQRVGECASPRGRRVTYQATLDQRGSVEGRGPTIIVAPDGTRHVRIGVGQTSDATVQWVVETAREIVVGVRVAVVCGGHAPPFIAFDLVLPASNKPVRVAVCHVGRCGAARLP